MTSSPAGGSHVQGGAQQGAGHQAVGGQRQGCRAAAARDTLNEGWLTTARHLLTLSKPQQTAAAADGTADSSLTTIPDYYWLSAAEAAAAHVA